MNEIFKNMQTTKQPSENTMKLLMNISRRLSGRKDCRKVTYVLVIDRDETKKCQRIEFAPSVYVYPNTHSRKYSDRVEIISYVAKTVFDCSKSNLPNFIPGVYIYQKSFNNMKRKWIRVR